MKSSGNSIRASHAFRHDLFSGKLLVIAGAGGAFGRLIAREMVCLGASIALVDEDEKSLIETKIILETITDSPGTFSTHSCQLDSKEDVVKVISSILSRHGRIDGLINDMTGLRFTIAAEPSDRIDIATRSAVTNRFSIAQEMCERWPNEHGGPIVSLISELWLPCSHPRHTLAARRVMTFLTESAAADWRERRVTVNCVAPAMSSSVESSAPGGEQLPWNEVVSAITFLLSPAGQNTSGTCLNVGRAVGRTMAQPVATNLTTSSTRH